MRGEKEIHSQLQNKRVIICSPKMRKNAIGETTMKCVNAASFGNS
jgi:hypothetical protein